MDGIDPTSVELWVDGSDVTGSIVLAPIGGGFGVSYVPPSAFAYVVFEVLAFEGQVTLSGNDQQSLGFMNHSCRDHDLLAGLERSRRDIDQLVAFAPRELGNFRQRKRQKPPLIRDRGHEWTGAFQEPDRRQRETLFGDR